MGKFIAPYFIINPASGKWPVASGEYKVSSDECRVATGLRCYLGLLSSSSLESSLFPRHPLTLSPYLFFQIPQSAIRTPHSASCIWVLRFTPNASLRPAPHRVQGCPEPDMVQGELFTCFCASLIQIRIFAFFRFGLICRN
jgi:hypothetical protein